MTRTSRRVPRAGRRHPLARDDLRSLEAGLDRLQTGSREHARAAGAASPRASCRRVVFVVVLIVVWQLYVVHRPAATRHRARPDRRASARSATAWESGRLQEAVITSLERGVVGFLIAIVVGTPIGLLLAEVRPLRRAVGPIISGLQVLPSVAWVPAAIIWFGLSDATVYFVILMGAIPSIVNGLIAGVDQVPPQLRRVGTVLGASRIAARDRRDPPRRPARLPRRAQAGLGLLLAVADGR